MFSAPEGRKIASTAAPIPIPAPEGRHLRGGTSDGDAIDGDAIDGDAGFDP